MPGKAHRPSSGESSPSESAGPGQGAQDLGSNSARQEELKNSKEDSGPMEATVIQVMPYREMDAKVLVGKGEKHGVKQGWEAISGGEYGYVMKVFPTRAYVRLYATKDMNGEEAMPEPGPSMTIYRRRAPWL